MATLLASRGVYGQPDRLLELDPENRFGVTAIAFKKGASTIYGTRPAVKSSGVSDAVFGDAEVFRLAATSTSSAVTFGENGWQNQFPFTVMMAFSPLADNVAAGFATSDAAVGSNYSGWSLMSGGTFSGFSLQFRMGSNTGSISSTRADYKHTARLTKNVRHVGGAIARSIDDVTVIADGVFQNPAKSGTASSMVFAAGQPAGFSSNRSIDSWCAGDYEFLLVCNRALNEQEWNELAANPAQVLVADPVYLSVSVGGASFDAVPSAATVQSITSTGATPKCTITRTGSSPAGTLYYVIYPDGLSAPSAAQVIAGQDSTGSAATASGNEACRTTNGDQVFASPASGLTPSTAYRIAFVASDGTTDSAVAASASEFTTSASEQLIEASGGAAASGSAAIVGSVALVGVGVTTAGGSAAAKVDVAISALGLAVSGGLADISSGTLSEIDASGSGQAGGAAQASANVTISALGLAQAAGAAGLSADVLIAGSGAAQASGNAALAATLSTMASGAAQAGGSATVSAGAAGDIAASGSAVAGGSSGLVATVTLFASGGAQAGGAASATGGASSDIAATGGAQSGGSATAKIDVAITASGFVQAMGAGYLVVQIPLGAVGAAMAGGSASISEYVPMVLIEMPGFIVFSSGRSFSVAAAGRRFVVTK